MSTKAKSAPKSSEIPQKINAAKSEKQVADQEKGHQSQRKGHRRRRGRPSPAACGKKEGDLVIEDRENAKECKRMRRKGRQQMAAEQRLGRASEPTPGAIEMAKPRKAAVKGELRHSQKKQIEKHRESGGQKQQIEEAKRPPPTKPKPPFHDTRPPFFCCFFYCTIKIGLLSNKRLIFFARRAIMGAERRICL